jgi:hypothetical protein
MTCSLAVPTRGRTWLVLGYHTGNFIGRCEAIGPRLATFTVIDTLRPLPRIADRCPFPGCVRGDFHDNDHELAPVRLGATIEIFWQNARYAPAEQSEYWLARANFDPWSAPSSTRA